LLEETSNTIVAAEKNIVFRNRYQSLCVCFRPGNGFPSATNVVVAVVVVVVLLLLLLLLLLVFRFSTC